jgi:hypothetical protein
LRGLMDIFSDVIALTALIAGLQKMGAQLQSAT